VFHLVIAENQEEVNLVQVEIKFKPTFFLLSNQFIWGLNGNFSFCHTAMPI
jgi:hypothetical protein